MTTRSRIAEYWFDKGIDRKTFAVVELTEHTNFSEVELVVIDWGEPQCWACGKSIVVEQAEENESLSQVWNKCKLERCHIIAKQFGGSDEPENLFLLCPKCHLESPDTKNPNNFYAWVISKKTNGGCIQDIANGIKTAAKIKHIDADQIFLKVTEKNCFFNVDEQRKMVKRLVKSCGFHGARVVDSTKYMTLIDEIMKEE